MTKARKMNRIWMKSFSRPNMNKKDEWTLLITQNEGEWMKSDVHMTYLIFLTKKLTFSSVVTDNKNKIKWLKIQKGSMAGQ